jgi:3-phenylpropionate/trans-cinnamate dioxygenase ferredoxin subunit
MMSGMATDPRYQRACAAARLGRGKVVAVTVDGIPMAVVRTQDDQFFALRDECPHQFVTLSDGDVVDAALECALHGSRFDLHTGKPAAPPATDPVAVFPVEVHDGDVYVLPVSSNRVE